VEKENCDIQLCVCKEKYKRGTKMNGGDLRKIRASYISHYSLQKNQRSSGNQNGALSGGEIKKISVNAEGQHKGLAKF